MKVELRQNCSRWDGRADAGSLIVLIDVLRATSSVVTAFHYGCRAVVPVSSLFSAFRKRSFDRRVILCGERFGLRVPGFDFGNSPTDLATPELRGREIVFTSTNGGKIFLKTPYESPALVGSFLNIDTVAQTLLREKRDVLIVCAGANGEDSEEDWLAAGLLSGLLQKEAALSFLAEAAADYFYKKPNDLCRVLRETEHGKRLIRLGLEKDVALCASRNIMPVVPVLRQRRITLWE